MPYRVDTEGPDHTSISTGSAIAMTPRQHRHSQRNHRTAFARFAPISQPNGLAHVSVSLSDKVLVLNQNYEPLSVCSVRKAVVLLWLGKAEMVQARSHSALRTVASVYPYPSIVRLFVYVRLPFRKVELTRKNIIRRDSHQCGYCGAGKPPLTIDHVVPKSRGGRDTWENLVTACIRCNNKKGNRTPEEAGMLLHRKPFKPNHVTFLRKFAGRIEREWEQYLFMQ